MTLNLQSKKTVQNIEKKVKTGRNKYLMVYVVQQYSFRWVSYLHNVCKLRCNKGKQKYKMSLFHIFTIIWSITHCRLYLRMDRSNLSNWWWSNIRKVVRYFRKKYLLLWYLHEYKKVVLYVLWKILPICFHFKNWIPSWFSLGLDLTKPIICLYYTFNKWILLHNSSTIFSLTAKKSCESLQRTPCTSLYNSIHQRRSIVRKKVWQPQGVILNR